MRCSCVLLVLAAATALPEFSPQRHMVIKWSAKVLSEKKSFAYMEHHYYDTDGQFSRIDSINATDAKTMLVTKLDRPSKEGLSYQYDWKKQQCTEWDFKGTITGFALLTPDMTKTVETMDGTPCDKYSRTLKPAGGPAWTYTVWVRQAAPQVPVAVYSSNWEQKTGDTLDDGIRHVSGYSEAIPAHTFDAAFPTTCSKPPAPAMGRCDAASKSCLGGCKQGEPGCTTMAVCQLQLNNTTPCGTPPGPDGYSCDWSTHTCKPDPTVPGQGKPACEAMCHP